MRSILKRIIALLLVSTSLIVFSDFSAFSMGSNAKIEEEYFEEFDRFSNSDPDAYILANKKRASIEEDFNPDRVIVVLKNKFSSVNKTKDISDFNSSLFSEVKDLSYVENYNGKDKEVLNRVNEDEFHQILSLKLKNPGKESVLKAIEYLHTLEEVLSAEPDYIYKVKESYVPNDTFYDSQWGLERINIDDAWDITRGLTTIKVGIFESGITSHEDISSVRIAQGNLQYGNDVSHEHGNYIAGVIGATSNNSKGVAGVAQVKLAVLDNFNFSDSLIYATNNNIGIINASFHYETNDGNYASFNSAHAAAIQNYPGLLICAAGNIGANLDNTPCYPAAYTLDNVITVAATNTNDVLCTTPTWSSNYSSSLVHLAAPGESIYTTSASATNSYSSPSGTSMAAPFVTGVAALLKSKYPGMDAEALKDYILSNVDVIPALNGKVVTGGRLNAYKALTNLKNYTVQYNANGGGGVGYLPTTMIYGCATPLNSNNFGKSGHSFVGWHAKRTDNNKWFYTNGSDSDWYTEGSQPSGYSKYTFSDGEAISRTIEPGKTMVMYAQWEKRFNIQFMGNNATSGTVADMVISEGQNYTLPSSGFTRTGCTLQYWYAKDSDGNYYFSNNGDKIWHSMSNIPSGYVRTQYAPGSVITANDVDGIDYDETIYMYAYWQPNSGLLGDVNGDGDINVKDSTKIQSYVSGLTTLTAAQLIRADVDFSGVVNTKDATAIQKYASGMLLYFG